MANKKILNKKVGQVHVVGLSSYTRPEVKEVYNRDWISYGDDNNYFQYLIDRYNGSPTNNAAINGIAEMIYGKGLDAVESKEKASEYEEMKSLLTKKVIKKICYDYKMMGQAAIQVIYSKDRKKIAQIEHIPVETLRAEKCDENGDIVMHETNLSNSVLASLWHCDSVHTTINDCIERCVEEYRKDSQALGF